ncbi:Retrovirus-related Pol polyprotein from transposon opus [Vitis vinifera]|uniref:RNA-directed DNA polymerase n=1 Tax=Vitis vinifera TaxID=29760 RepID=A0A438GKM4_VITVI|nr:Retrovirus-related Pol polyprotein from transposon opus [Vitis vinifera]
MKYKLLLKHQCKDSRVLFVTLMNTWWRNALHFQLKEMFGDQANVIGQFKPNNNAPYGNTYNSSWRNHPNFSWKARAPQYQQRLNHLNNLQCKRRVDFLLNLTKTPRVSMKWKLMRENLHRGLNVNKKAFLTEQVSAIIQCKSPLKYKDPGCPTISVMIGRKVVEKALLDLGADVNLLPYSVYKQLGLDFVVLDTDPTVKEANSVPIILGRPFLATSNAIINCRNGLMQLTFGNMTLELNIFYMSKNQITPEEEEGPEEVCIIDTLVEEHCNQNMQDKLNESLGDLEEGLSEPLDVLATLQSWKRREGILPLFNKEEGEAAEEETPKLNLKPLPVELKYTYLEENNQCPIVISSSLTSHQRSVYLKFSRGEEAKPIHQPQRRLNPHLQKVVHAEVLKLLQVGIIYPISDSPWVSPTQVVPKKSGITVVQNEKGEEIATRLTSGWRRRPLSHVHSEHMLTEECLLVYAMHLQHSKDVCLVSSVIWWRIMEVFMDDITVYGGTFEKCLVNLEAVLNRCIEKDLVLNWEKCHFMVRQGIVLGHIISEKGIEVDKAKVELIVKLPSPTTMKGMSKYFDQLKQFLTTAPIVRVPNWKLPFEVMCDASDFAVGVVLGQREYGKPYVIYYASKTLNEAQMNYTTTEKELLAVVFALDKFRAYLVGSFIIVFIDHSTLKYFLTKQDAKARLIRWILLLQEFDLQIRDKKRVENVVADHLFKKAPWYAHIANYLVTGEVPSEWNAQDRKHFFAKIHAYYWEEPFLFKYCADQIIRKCVPEEEQQGILSHCHENACGGHFAS